jgi:cation transport regulator ChaC
MDADFLAELLGVELAPGWPAEVRGWRLAFNKGGEGDAGASVFANLAEGERCRTCGVVYRIPREALVSLDEFEQAPEHYRRETLWVEPMGRRARQAALVYIAQPKWIVAEGQPDEAYFRRLLNGAAAHGLPKGYLDWLRAQAQGTAEEPYRGSR